MPPTSNKAKFLSLRKLISSLTPELKFKWFDELSKSEKKVFATTWEFLARDDQLPPEGFGTTLTTWMDVSGRGSGKTRKAVETLCNFIERPPVNNLLIGVLNKTDKDVKKIAIEGDSGFLKVLRRRGYKQVTQNPRGKQFKYLKSPGEIEILFGNGCKIQFFSADKPDKLAGYQFHIVWLDEFFVWTRCEETWDILQFCIRLPGMTPLKIITSTPRPKKILKKFLNDPLVALTRSKTIDNFENLSPEFLAEVIERYKGTRLGMQELEGVVLDDIPGALWTYPDIERARRDKIFDADQVHRLCSEVCIGVDPAVSSGEDACETGIFVCGKLRDTQRGAVIEDRSVHGKPGTVCDTIRQILLKYGNIPVVVEKNNGGEWIKELIEDSLKDLYPEVVMVHASKGKRERAEPISNMYEQGRIEHWGYIEETDRNTLEFLEDQMLTFVSGNKHEGPVDRVDAVVWAFTHLFFGVAAPRAYWI